MKMERLRLIPRMAALVAAVAGCASGPAFPETIDFGSEHLTKAAGWTREGISGIVYVPAGQQLPGASPQVGVIVSAEHTTGVALHDWVREQFARSGGQVFHESGSTGESCKMLADAAGGGTRISLQVCKTGVTRAACVEADEAMDQGTFTTCLNNRQCFEDVCDRGWLARREGLDVLVADFLTRR